MESNISSKAKGLLKNRKAVASAFILLVILLAGYNHFFGAKAPSYNFIVAQKKNITQDVSATGNVKPAQITDLSFERAGKINNVYAKIGDKVKLGQPLASINGEEVSANLAGAEAQLESAQAQLKELTNGTRPEEIQIAETAVSGAQKSLADAETQSATVKQTADISLNNLYGKVGDILNDSYAKADNAINTQIANLFSTASLSNPQLTFITTDSQAKIDSEFQRTLAGNSLAALKTDINNLPADHAGMDNSLSDAKNQLIIMRNFLTRLSATVTSAAGLSSTTLDTYRSSVNTAWTNINTAIANINDQEQLIAGQKTTNQNNINTAQKAVNEAQGALNSAADTLALKKAGSTLEQIDAQKAQVKQVEAQIKIYEVQLNQSALVSPVNGTVTRQDAKIGETVSANVPIVSVISDAQFQIETNIAEADIAKVAIGNPAKVTLDAYGLDVNFDAEVMAVDPAETVVEGVSTYKTTLQFKAEDGRLKPGMTANIDILTASRENVIAIPQRLVITQGQNKFVKVLNKDGTTSDVSVKTGLRDSEGNIEITEGIAEGDKLIISSL